MKPSILYYGLLLSVLSACGGGGGGGGGGSNNAPATPGTLSAACSGAACGAESNSRYSGQGSGIWRYHNSYDNEATLNIVLDNVRDRDILLILSNHGEAARSITLPASNSLRASQSKSVAHQDHGYNRLPAYIREDNHRRLPPTDGKASSSASRSLSQPLRAAVVGDGRSWNDHQDRAHLTTLRRQSTAADGRRINIWVENGEYGQGRLSDATLDTVQNRFSNGTNSVYSMVTELAGQPWGSHNSSGLIAATQDLDIVLLNLTPDQEAFGLLGFFWSRNNFLKSQEPLSNESLSFYMDSETLYLGGNTGQRYSISTLAHELVHMINFYQRAVRLRGYAFETWLEEMSAVMMEDVVGLRLDANFHALRDDRYPDWLRDGGYNCKLTVFVDNTANDCFSYPVLAAYGGFLLRQHGLGFYQAMLRSQASTNSAQLLDSVLRDHGSSLGQGLQRHGANIALLSLPAPAGFGLPRRQEGGHDIPALNGPDFSAVRTLPAPGTQLMGYAHTAVVRQAVGDRYSETLRVPSGVGVTVVVQ